MERSGGRHHTRTVAFEHAERAAHEVAELVRELAVASLSQALDAEVSVLSCANVAQKVVPQGVDPKLLDDIYRVGPVSERLADLHSIDSEIPVHVDLGRQRGDGRQENGGPVDAVKPRDALAQKVDPPRAISPVALVERAVDGIPEPADVIAEGV